MPGYLAAPVPRTNMPGGIPYIIANEAAERFSFYGMRAILVVFMTQYLLSKKPISFRKQQGTMGRGRYGINSKIRMLIGMRLIRF